MTSDISICGISVKPTAVKWRCSVSDYTDTCTIELPLSLYAKTNGGGNKSLPFYEGGDVIVMLGYNGRNTTRFMGKVLRINYAVPLQIECEGYSYDLRKKRFTKSYQKTTALQLIKDLCNGTDIIIQIFNQFIRKGNLNTTVFQITIHSCQVLYATSPIFLTNLISIFPVSIAKFCDLS